MSPAPSGFTYLAITDVGALRRVAAGETTLGLVTLARCTARSSMEARRLIGHHGYVLPESYAHELIADYRETLTPEPPPDVHPHAA